MRHTDTSSALIEVRRTVARHLDTPPQSVLARHVLRDDLGLSRIDLTLLAMQLEDRFQIDLPFFMLEGITTVADLGAWIDTLVGSDHNE